MYSPSGYKVVTPIQLLNALALVEQKRIGFRCFRVYVAALAAVAIREAAARRTGRKEKWRKNFPVRYSLSELARVCHLSEAQVRSALRALRREQLLIFSDTEIKARCTPLPEAGEKLTLVRSPSRPIPIPRAVLRFMAVEQKASVSRVMVAYMIRGLTISRQGGELHGRGSAKLEWIAKLAGLSERSARYARARLISTGWLSDDTGSTQWKLNRDGAYFSIALSWQPESVSTKRSEIAPRLPQTAPCFAPPRENRKTPYGDQNQKTTSGVCMREPKGENAPPTFGNVRTLDLQHLGRLKTLYEQATNQGVLEPSESSALNFVAAAVRARESREGDPTRIFSAIIRRGLWHHITFRQEDVARKALARCRETDAMRVQPETSTFIKKTEPHFRTEASTNACNSAPPKCPRHLLPCHSSSSVPRAGRGPVEQHLPSDIGSGFAPLGKTCGEILSALQQLRRARPNV